MKKTQRKIQKSPPKKKTLIDSKIEGNLLNLMLSEYLIFFNSWKIILPLYQSDYNEREKPREKYIIPKNKLILKLRAIK